MVFHHSKLGLYFLYPAILLSLLSTRAYPQAESWDWAETATGRGKPVWCEILDVDERNNYYVSFYYEDTILLSGSVIGHYGTQISQYCAVVRYSSIYKGPDGIIDMYTQPENSIHDAQVITDSDMKIYLAAEFRTRVFLQDTFISHGMGPYSGSREVFLAQLDKDLKLEWSGLVSSETGDDLFGLTRKGDFIYVGVVHSPGNYNSYIAHYLGQDTVEFTHDVISILKVDFNGNLIWRRSLLTNYHALYGRDIFIGEDENLYVWGISQDHLIWGNDTIIHPFPQTTYPKTFLIRFDEDGTMKFGEFFSHDFNYRSVVVDKQKNIFYSALVYNNFIIGTDTIIINTPGNSSIIIKSDSLLKIEWYKYAYTTSSIVHPRIYLDLKNDSLVFTSPTRYDFIINEDSISVGPHSTALSASLSKEGVISDFAFFDNTKTISSTGIKTNNCFNPIISGAFIGSTYIGNDTINAFGDDYYDAIMTQAKKYPLPLLELGQDTIACDSLVIFAPEGYDEYIWNDGYSTEPEITVTQTGSYRLEMADENLCWVVDSLYIDIREPPIFNLPVDTTIKASDTIWIQGPEGYFNYLWSTGDTSTTLMFSGQNAQIGINTISLDVYNGPCESSDSMRITVIDDTGIDELYDSAIRLWPNPSDGIYYLQITDQPFSYQICDLKGRVQVASELILSPNKPLILNISHLDTGVYILKIYSDIGIRTGKIIKL